MKTPTNRSAFMDEIKAVLGDALCGSVQRSWLCRRNVSELMGREYYIEFTEENAPQLIDFKHYGGHHEVRIEFREDAEGLGFYVDGEYRQQLEFELYRTKMSYIAAVALWVDRYAC